MSTKQQLHQLRSGATVDLDDSNNQAPSKLPDIERPPSRRIWTPAARDFSEVRSNLRSHAWGIMKIPASHRQQHPASLLSDDPPTLPPKSAADQLIGQYFAFLHSYLPIIYLQSFVVEYEKVYQIGSLAGASRDWASLLFAVLACGCLHTREPNLLRDGKEYLKVCHDLLDLLQNDISIDQVRTSLLTSVFLHEVGSKSSSWAWLGTAVRLGQDIDLHIESGPLPTAEWEVRRRAWWSLYCWDRSVVEFTPLPSCDYQTHFLLV